MTNYKNLELRDGIARDARILLRNNPNLSYEEAFNIAKKELIGDNDILTIDVKPFDLVIDNNLLKENDNKSDKEILNNADMELYKPIASKIDITQYDKAQLKKYLIGDRMGVDITLFANPRFSPKQIQFLNIMVASNKDVDEYFNNYDFDVEQAYDNVDKAKSKQYIKRNTNN